MKFKYNHDGETLSIPLTDTKPAGKSFAVRHNGTTFYATTVPVDDPLATDCTFVIDGQPCALSRGVAPNSVTLGGASFYEVTAEDRQRGVTVTDFSNSVNITGLTFSDIKICSYSNRTITLGLVGKVKIILPNATTNALIFNGATVYVGTDMFFNNSDFSVVNKISLTAYNTAGIDKSNTRDYNLNIDGSKVKADITIQGGGGADEIISGSKGNNSLKGNGGADIFIYSGGKDTIADYTVKDEDAISLASDGLLDFDNPEIDDDFNVTIGGAQGDSLVVIGGAAKGVKLTVIGANGKEQIYSYYNETKYEGTLNDDSTAITLPANYPEDFNPNTNGNYVKIATIDASAVEKTIAVSAINTNPSCLIAGEMGLSLMGGNKNDTLMSGTGNSTLKGGKGADLFMHQGGTDVITDYTANDLDKVRLAKGNMGDVSGVTVGASKGVTLTFGGNGTGTIELANIAKTDTVTFASADDSWGIGYVFENNKVRTASGRGVTLTTAENYTVGGEIISVIANAGGTITGGTNNATLGGYNVSIVAGTGKEVFLCKGGNMTVNGCGVKDTISLLADCNLPWSLPRSENYTLQTDSGKLVLQNYDISGGQVTLYSNGIYKKALIPNQEGYIVSGNGDKVTLFTAYADFGVIGSASGISDGQVVVNGEEYATTSAIVSITATQEDSHLVGNAKANTFYIAGGDSNILTGGIKNDTFIFESGGGVITDFGVGTTKNGENKYLATTTKRSGTSTYVAFDRDDPTSYAEGTDALQVNGTVVEIAFKYDSENYDSSKENTFTAYVTYVADGDLTTTTNDVHTIALANIAKKATTTNKTDISKAVYCTNLEQMQGSYTTTSGTTATCTQPQIYDTSTGTSAQLTGTALTDLFVDKSNSAHSSAIAALDAIIQARGITTYSTTAPYYIVSASNGIVAAYAAQQGGTS